MAASAAASAALLPTPGPCSSGPVLPGHPSARGDTPRGCVSSLLGPWQGQLTLEPGTVPRALTQCPRINHPQPCEVHPKCPRPFPAQIGYHRLCLLFHTGFCSLPLGVKKPWDKAMSRGQCGLAQRTPAVPADGEHFYSLGDCRFKDVLSAGCQQAHPSSSGLLVAPAALAGSRQGQPG